MKNPWDLEDELDEEQEEDFTGDLVNSWDAEAGWVKDVHLIPLDKLFKRGYPDINVNPRSLSLGSGEKPLGSTGLRRTPSGLYVIWNDLAKTWSMSMAKVQRITICHGICIWAKDPWYIDIHKIHRKLRRLMRGITDTKTLDEFTSSSLAYYFNPAAERTGGSIGYLTNRLGIISEISNGFGVIQSTALIELSIASIMTLENKKLGRWLVTIQSEYDGFRLHGEKRRQALDALHERLIR